MARPPGQQDLAAMLSGLTPWLDPAVYLFVGLAPGDHVPAALQPIGRFHEHEGETLIVEREAAERASLEGVFPCRRIVLGVDSALDAVGLLAAVASALAEAGIPANTVSALHHDHLFVPAGCEQDALSVLTHLGQGGRTDT